VPIGAVLILCKAPTCAVSQSYDFVAFVDAEIYVELFCNWH